MTEKLDLGEELHDEFDDFPTVQWRDDVVETNEVTAYEADEFVNSIIGVGNAPVDTGTKTPTRESDEVSDSQLTLQQNYDKYHKSAVTKGGKTIRIVKDEWGTFWHVEFVPGGQLPLSLSGKYTTAEAAELDVQVYLNSQV